MAVKNIPDRFAVTVGDRVVGYYNEKEDARSVAYKKWESAARDGACVQVWDENGPPNSPYPLLCLRPSDYFIDTMDDREDVE